MGYRPSNASRVSLSVAGPLLSIVLSTLCQPSSPGTRKYVSMALAARSPVCVLPEPLQPTRIRTVFRILVSGPNDGLNRQPTDPWNRWLVQMRACPQRDLLRNDICRLKAWLALLIRYGQHEREIASRCFQYSRYCPRYMAGGSSSDATFAFSDTIGHGSSSRRRTSASMNPP